MNSKLKQTEVRGLTYQYIDYGSDSEIKSSVEGLIIPINSEVRESLLDVGGFYRDLLTPLSEDESVNRIVILSATEKSMSQMVGFFFDNGEEDLKVSWTKEPRIVSYYEGHVEKKNISYENINTLEFLQQEDAKEVTNEKYFSILDDYYNPVSADDTGIHIDGKAVQYGETVTINNFKKMLDKFESLKESNLGKLNVDKIVLPIYESGPRFMGTIGSGEIYNEEGRVITNIESYYYSYVSDSEEDYDRFLEEYKIGMLHEFALRINRRLRSRPNEKERIMKQYMEEYERELKENDEPVSEMIGLSILLECINEGLVTVKE